MSPRAKSPATARDVMTPPPAVVTSSSTITAAARVMSERNVSLLPVVDDAENARLEGLITDRDILERCVSARHGPGCTVRDHMTRHPLVVVTPDDAVDEVVQRMESACVHRVPVVEPTGRVVGIITRRDLAVGKETR